MVDDLVMLAIQKGMDEDTAMKQEIVRHALTVKANKKVENELREIRYNLEKVRRKPVKKIKRKTLASKYSRA